MSRCGGWNDSIRMRTEEEAQHSNLDLNPDPFRDLRGPGAGDRQTVGDDIQKMVVVGVSKDGSLDLWMQGSDGS